jgi:hypothetical protein
LSAQEALQAVGYVEEEFLLSGQAQVYDFVSGTRDLQVVAGPGPYVTRILVRRPRDAKKFSGNVEVMILNATGGIDLGSPIDFKRMIQQGDVWIGVTSKPLAANALKKFDPERYAALNWNNPAPAEKRCSQPSIIPMYMVGGEAAFQAMSKMGVSGSAPETEDGLIWDMLGQLGLLLKGDERQRILPGFRVPTVYMDGISQSSLYVRTWVGAFHDRYRAADGHPVYDGYLGIVGPALVRLNQCAADVPLDDPRQKITPPDVPFISLSSEGEMWTAKYTHQPDAFTRNGGIVTYEVAGGSHVASDVPGLSGNTTGLGRASPEDLAKAGAGEFFAKVKLAPPPPDFIPNDFVWAPIIRGAYHNLQLWARSGTRPPQAPEIDIDKATLTVQRDQHGNALGGLRTPYIEVPVATHTGSLSAGGMGSVTGSRKPFTPSTLKALYPDHATYVSRFSAATDQAVSGRWISAEDGAAMKKAAEASPIP